MGVVLPDITNPVFPPILDGLEAGLAENGYIVIVANAARIRPGSAWWWNGCSPGRSMG